MFFKDDAQALPGCLKLSILFFSSLCLRSKQRVIRNVHSITREIETTDHDSPLLGLNDMMSIKPI